MSEISPENLAEIEKRYRAAAVIGVAQIAFTVLLAGAAWFVVRRTEVVEDNKSVTTLWILIAFVAIGSLLLRRLFSGWERLRNAALLGGISGVLKKLQTNSLILGMFAEVISIIGFVITIFTGSSFDMFRAAAIALIVFFVAFPRKIVWKKIVANLQGI
ncbi:MAG TPA: hypothetical protein PKM58_04950 [Pyrinomonadaceae bacterium]|nr:hypothetical protein [Pyrinomonadaceae bacterium]HNU06591.1 hypothetical protein [Pyrinomonadaceae bacterium]